MKRSARLRRSAVHINWGVLDQALSSGTNFGLALIVVRSVSSAAFGAFSICVLLYVLAIGLTRALTSEPLTIRASRDEQAIRSMAPACLGAALAIGLVVGAGCGLAAAFASDRLAPLLAALGVTFPLLLVQDSGRVICFALQRPRRAAANDAVWAVVEVVFVLLAVRASSPAVWMYVAAWLGSGALAGVYVLVQLSVIPSLVRLPGWLHEQRELGVPLLWNFLLTSTPPYLLFAFTPLVASLAALGLARAAYVPFGPFGIVLQSSWLLLLPAAARRTHAEVARLARWSSLALGALALCWSAVVSFGVPSGLGTTLIGDNWASTHSERIVFGCALTAQALGVGPLIAMRALERPRDLVRVRLLSAPLVLIGGLVLAGRWGAIGVAVGIALGDVSTTLLSWRVVRRSSPRARVADEEYYEPDPPPLVTLSRNRTVLSSFLSNASRNLARMRVVSG